MDESRNPVFKPFPLFRGRHAQTIAASFLTFFKEPKTQTRFVHLSDREKITFEVSTPQKWKEDNLTVIMVHGLCGSHRSPYLVRMAKKLYKRNIRSIRINLRGCGSGKGHAKRMYHPECSDDVWRALLEIKRDTPNSPLILMGFSLGGNIILKLAGERGSKAKTLLKKVIAINPPIDMQASVELLSKNKVYERYFMNYLRSDVSFRHNHFEDLPPIQIPYAMTMLEFDEFYIAPQSGYDSAIEYYHACSSGRLLSEIQIPCHILFAKDDPIVDLNVLNTVTIPSNVKLLITEQGGHLGFLGIPGKNGGFHWMDSTVLGWIFENAKH